VRELCTRHGILLIADEVMSGFGRTGEWFAVNHWDVVPDLMTMAKGLTSAYVPLGAVGMRRGIADYFIASTDLRSLIAEGVDPKFLMPDSVRRIILETECYAETP
jgi:adenosylmethionine-8-amino-7-oxononanoate aminotransferase